jgi:hypothetical protein
MRQGFAFPDVLTDFWVPLALTIEPGQFIRLELLIIRSLYTEHKSRAWHLGPMHKSGTLRRQPSITSEKRQSALFRGFPNG